MATTILNKRLFVPKVFEEPSLTIVGVGMSFNLGSVGGIQLLQDTGSFGDTTNGLQGISEGNELSGSLIRIAFPPLIDISYGIQTKDIGVLTVQTTTISIQFPFFEGSNLKIGLQTIKITDANDEDIAEFSYPKISFNVQFGKSTGSTRSVKPKTKTLSFIDRL